jgi:hypothetical protein
MMGGSTGFQLEEKESLDSWEGCTPAIARDLAKLDKSTLTFLVTKFPDVSLASCGTSKASMVTTLTGIQPEFWSKTHPWIGKNVEVVCLEILLFTDYTRCLTKNHGLVR